MQPHESTENYLETIYRLGLGGEPVRSIDVAGALDFARASVSVAVKGLRERGYVELSEEGHIALTDAGSAIAKSMYERHVLISDWLIESGVDGKTAVSDACRMEHAMSEQSFAILKRQIEEWRRTTPRGADPDREARAADESAPL